MSSENGGDERPSKWAKYRMWIFYLLILGFAALTLKDVTGLFIEYFSNPKKANMNMMFNTTINFPNMTFCMPRHQAMSHFVAGAKGMSGADNPSGTRLNGTNTTTTDSMIQQMQQERESKLTDMNKAIEDLLSSKFKTKEAFLDRKTEWEPDMVLSAYDAISEINLLERETAAQQTLKMLKMFAESKRNARARAVVKKWLKAIDDRNVTFAEFFQKVGMEVLRRSLRIFKRLSYTGDEFNMTTRISWVSQSMLCWQPIFMDTDSFRPIDEQGEFFQMMVLHNPMAYKDRQADCMSLDLHGRPTIDHRAMEGKGRVKDGIEEELCIAQIHEAEIKVRAHYQMLPNNAPSTACREYDDTESEYNCRSKCRMELIEKVCNCIPRTLEALADDDAQKKYQPCDYEHCDIPDDFSGTQNITDQECAKQCLPDCNQIRFDIDLDQKGRSVIPNKTVVTLQWGALEYLDLSQEYTYTFVSFIAALGGAIGIWLGLSVLSLIQLVTYFTKQATTTVRVKAKKRGDFSSYPIGGSSTRGPRGASKKEKREDPLSENQFGGPVAKNPFETPFVKPKQPQSQQTNNAANVAYTNGSGGQHETNFGSRAA